LALLFQLELDADAVASGAAFHTHSKDRSAYSAKQREDEKSRGKALHAREIGIVLEWAEQLASHAGIAMTLPSPLLD
jgi:hypothetical protein